MYGGPDVRREDTHAAPGWRGIDAASQDVRYGFRSLVRNLSDATGVPSAFVAEFAGSPSRVRTVAYWSDGKFLPSVEWDLRGTPCEDVVKGNLCHHPSGVSERFPEDTGLAGTESYLGVPLRAADETTLGHLAVYGPHPMPATRASRPDGRDAAVAARRFRPRGFASPGGAVLSSRP